MFIDTVRGEWVQRALWGAAVTGVTVLFSVSLSCGTPFAALAAVAAMHLSRRDATVLVLINWLANQVIGFAWLDYPHNEICYWNGVALAAALLAGTWAGLASHVWLQKVAPRINWLGTFATVFAIYEATLWVSSPFDRAIAFAPSVILYVFGINCGASIGFTLLSSLAKFAGCPLPRTQPKSLGSAPIA